MLSLLLFLFPLCLALNCPNNSQEFNGYCYQYMTTFPNSFANADQYCTQRGLANSHLASVMNAFENSYLLQQMSAGAKAWIGAMQQPNSSYVWIDGLPFSYFNIDNTTNGGSCLVLDKDTKKWQRVDCGASYGFFCKFVETPPFVISNSTGFKAAADYLLSGIDPTANPCNDFYQFTCGTYLKNAKLHGNDEVSLYDVAQTTVNTEIGNALAKVTAASSLTERITQAAYTACAYNYHLEDIPDHSQIIYQEIITAFNVTELPLFLPRNAAFAIDPARLVSAVGYFEGAMAVGTLINSYTTVDYQNISSNGLFMDQPVLLLPRDYYVKPQFLTALNDHVMEYVELIELWADDLNKEIDDNAIIQAANDIVQFEISIALASWPDEEMRNYKQLYNPYKLDALKSAYPNYPWDAYFNNLFRNSGFTSALLQTKDTIVGEPSYFSWLDSLFAGKQFSQSTIVNYISIQVLYDNADFLADNFAALARKFNRVPYVRRRGRGLTHIGARQIQRKFDSTDDYCVDIIMDYMPYGPGYVYVKQIPDALRNSTIADVSSQTTSIISSFKSMIGTLSWMTTQSKNNAYTKAGALIKNVGWPAMFGDLKSTTALDAYHQDYAPIANMGKKQYWDILLVLKSASQLRESWKLLMEPADRTNFLGSPAEVNAWYQPERNSITFPYAAFNPPYYNFDWPQAFNYGGQGGTGGHELTHGYDDEGVQFGPDGSLSNCDAFHCGWMDLNSTSGFIDMAQCVVTQYSTQCCPVKTGNVHCANGATTQGENIADLGGQQAAYRAYRNYIATVRNGVEEPRLPGLEEYTPNQIFWISYGVSWCEKQTIAALVDQLLLDPHAPSVCRTNNVMQDIPEFGKDFSCPQGSVMYPQIADRCKVWVGE